MIITGEREIILVTGGEVHFHQLYSLANNPKIAMESSEIAISAILQFMMHVMDRTQSEFNPPSKIRL